MGIQNLSVAASVTAGDMIPLASAGLGGDAKVSLATLATFLQSQIQSLSIAQTTYAAPNATGFTISPTSITPGADILLLMTPVSDYATGTIVLPALPVDGQKFTASSTHAVSALTVNGNGAAVNGSPSVLVAGGFFTLRFDAVTKSWYRIA
jgi:hypothetical protein